MDATVKRGADGLRHYTLVNEFDGAHREVAWLERHLEMEGFTAPFKSRREMVDRLRKLKELRALGVF